MKKDKKNLAKLAVTALLLATTLPASTQAEVIGAKETYFAVAACGAKCSRAVGNSYGCAGKASNPNGGSDVAEADDIAVPPPGSSSGAINRTRPPGTNGNAYDNTGTGARTNGGNYANPNDQYQGNRGTNNPYGK